LLEIECVLDCTEPLGEDEAGELYVVNLGGTASRIVSGGNFNALRALAPPRLRPRPQAIRPPAPTSEPRWSRKHGSWTVWFLIETPKRAVICESSTRVGEDYGYAANRFFAIDLPKPLEKALLKAASWPRVAEQRARADGLFAFARGRRSPRALGRQNVDQDNDDSAMAYTRSLGSRTSRNQSPTRLTPSAVRARAAPGKAASHHAT
jgi:hypothetical protein